MIISHSRQFTFVHIHKAGGTSVEQALEPHLAWNDLILGGSPLGERMQGAYSKRFGLNKHSTVADIEATCGSRYVDEYFLFALVRHPAARLCSIYNFVATTLNKWALRQEISLSDVAARVTPLDQKKTPALGWSSSRVFLQTRGFSDFIRDERLKAAPGFRSQVSILTAGSDGKIKGNIFRLEDYSKWAKPVGKHLGLEFSLPHANRSGLRLVEADSISTSDREFIESHFQADYDALGYSR